MKRHDRPSQLRLTTAQTQSPKTLRASFAPRTLVVHCRQKLDRQMQALEGVRLLKSEAQKRIEETLARVWGE